MPPIGTIVKITGALQVLRYCCIQDLRAFHIGKRSKGGIPPPFYAPLCDNSDPCAEIEFNHSALLASAAAAQQRGRPATSERASYRPSDVSLPSWLRVVWVCHVCSVLLGHVALRCLGTTYICCTVHFLLLLEKTYVFCYY